MILFSVPGIFSRYKFARILGIHDSDARGSDGIDPQARTMIYYDLVDPSVWTLQ